MRAPTASTGSTPILMGDGRTKALADVRVGEEVYGTGSVGRYDDSSGPPCSRTGGASTEAFRSSSRTAPDDLRAATTGFSRSAAGSTWPPPRTSRRAAFPSDDEQRPPWNRLPRRAPAIGHRRLPDGYLCGMVRGDGLLASYAYHGRRRGDRHPAPLPPGARRLRGPAANAALSSRRSTSKRESSSSRRASGRAQALARDPDTCGGARRCRIRAIVRWPDSDPDSDWSKGFLAGIFDAEGSYSRGILRIVNTDSEPSSGTSPESLARFGFDFIVGLEAAEEKAVHTRCGSVAAFASICASSTQTNPRSPESRRSKARRIKNDARLRVTSVEPLGSTMPLFDITTGTGDFIANGVVSHNCYARPTHQYLGWGAGTDFDRKIVVKVNAPELLRQRCCDGPGRATRSSFRA